MQSSIDEALKLIAAAEGGYSNHPNDPGGPTMKGVTLATYTAYRKKKKRPKPTVNDLKRITDEEVEEIFRTNYWNRVRGDSLPAGVDFAVADFAFNSGATQAVKELQRTLLALGHDPDGADGTIGDMTIAALESAMTEEGEDEVINSYMDRRWAFMQKLKNFSSFKNGWRNRIRDVRANGLALAHGDATYLPEPQGTGYSAKAEPAEVKATSVSGAKPVLVAAGSAVATGATATAGTLLEKTADSGNLNLMLVGIGAFTALTLVASVVGFFVLRNKPAEEGAV